MHNLAYMKPLLQSWWLQATQPTTQLN